MNRCSSPRAASAGRALAFWAAVWGLLVLAAAPAGAQWSDAQQPRRGEFQFGAGFQTTTADHRFTPDGSRQSLAEVLTAELDSNLVPALDSLTATLAALFPALGIPAPGPSSLGPVSHDMLLERTELPLALSYGVTDWLAPFVLVPFVSGRSFVVTMVDSASATAGPSGSAFGQDPAGFLGALDSGIGAMTGIVAADTLPPDRQVQAQALLADAIAVQTGLADLSALSYMPTAAGSNGQALLGFYDSLTSGFDEFEVVLPALALAMTVDAQQAAGLSAGPSFGIEPLEGRETGFRIGDVEAGVAIQPFNSFRDRDGDDGPLFRQRVRLEALWRFATGERVEAPRLDDVGAGDGQPDIELRAAWDAGFGRRFWLSLYGSYTIQLAAEVERLITDPFAPIQLGAITTQVRWDPGEILRVGAAPRFNLTNSITFSLLYLHASHGGDRVDFTQSTDTSGAFPIGSIEIGTEYSTNSIGFAARYASTDWTGDDRSPAFPIEVELRHLKTTSGKNGLPLKRVLWEVAVRYYLDDI